MTAGHTTANEPSWAKILALLAITLIVAVSIIQGAFLPGILAAVGVLLLFCFATWVKRSEDRSTRIDLMDERIVELDERVRKIEKREGT